MKTLHAKLGIFGSCPISLLKDENVKPAAIKAFIALMSFEGTKDDSYPSLEEIAVRAGIAKNAKLEVRRNKTSAAIKNLVDNGWLFVLHRGCGKTNRYQCLLKADAPEKGERNEMLSPEHGEGVSPSTCEHESTPQGDSYKKRPIEKTTIKDQICADALEQPKSTLPEVLNELPLYQRTLSFFLGAYEKLHKAKLVIDDVQGASIKKLIKRAEAEDSERPENVLAKRLNVCAYKINNATSDYWADFKFMPSKVLGRWNELVEDMPKLTKDEIRRNERRKRQALI